MRHRSADELVAGLDHVRASPRSEGRLEAIVVRPATDARRSLPTCRLTVSHGAEGDRWVTKFPSPPLPGSKEQESQITLMNARAADLVAVERERWPLAGDQLYVDFDLSEDHLKAGDRIAIGTAVLEVTAQPHDGCRKFADRYGAPALALVNSSEGKRLHLRGLYARVIQSGQVNVGDRVTRLPAAT